MKPVNVLFVGGAKRVSAAERLRRAASDLGYELRLFSYESSATVPIADAARIILGRPFSDPDCLPHLEETCRRLDIAIAIPYHDRAIAHLSRLASRGVFVPTCRPDRCDTFDSKIQTNRFFIEQGIPVAGFDGRVPAIAKPERGSASQGLLRFNEQSELDRFLRSPDASGYEVQRLLAGQEVSVDGYIALNSRFFFFVPRVRLETLGGEAVRSKTITCPEVLDHCARVARADGIRGAITVQFIRDPDRSVFCGMEINARFGGGMLTSLGAGASFFHFMLRDWLHLEQEEGHYLPNVLMVRSFREHFFTEES